MGSYKSILVKSDSLYWLWRMVLFRSCRGTTVDTMMVSLVRLVAGTMLVRLVAGTIGSISPSQGPMEGVPVSVTGTGLTAGMTCKFGATGVSMTIINSTHATCQAPMADSSDIPVSIAVYDGATLVPAGIGVATTFQYHPSLL